MRIARGIFPRPAQVASQHATTPSRLLRCTLGPIFEPKALSVALAAAMPDYIRAIVTRLHAAGHQVYIVGGAIRNTALKIPVHDWDITTSARPPQVQQIFQDLRQGGFGPDRGFVQVFPNGGPKAPVEIYTFRMSTVVVPNAPVMFTQDIRLDLSLRDITINAMAWSPITGELLDPYDGLSDLHHQIVRPVGHASENFMRNPIHAFRAIRIAAQLNFRLANGFVRETAKFPWGSVAPQWYAAEELRLILELPRCEQALNHLFEARLFDGFIPELAAGSRLFVPAGRRRKHLSTYLPALCAACRPNGTRFTPQQTALMRLAILVWACLEVSRLAQREPDLMKKPRRFSEILAGLHLSKRDQNFVDKVAVQFDYIFDKPLHYGNFGEMILGVGQFPHEVLELVLARQWVNGLVRFNQAARDQMHATVERTLHPFPVPVTDQDLMAVFERPPGSWLRSALVVIRHIVLHDPHYEDRENLLAFLREHREVFWAYISTKDEYTRLLGRTGGMSEESLLKRLESGRVDARFVVRDDNEPPKSLSMDWDGNSPEAEALRLRMNAALDRFPPLADVRDWSFRKKRFAVTLRDGDREIPMCISYDLSPSRDDEES